MPLPYGMTCALTHITCAAAFPPPIACAPHPPIARPLPTQFSGPSMAAMDKVEGDPELLQSLIDKLYKKGRLQKIVPQEQPPAVPLLETPPPQQPSTPAEMAARDAAKLRELMDEWEWALAHPSKRVGAGPGGVRACWLLPRVQRLAGWLCSYPGTACAACACHALGALGSAVVRVHEGLGVALAAALPPPRRRLAQPSRPRSHTCRSPHCPPTSTECSAADALSAAVDVTSGAGNCRGAHRLPARRTQRVRPHLRRVRHRRAPGDNPFAKNAARRFALPLLHGSKISMRAASTCTGSSCVLPGCCRETTRPSCGA